MAASHKDAETDVSDRLLGPISANVDNDIMNKLGICDLLRMFEQRFAPEGTPIRYLDTYPFVSGITGRRKGKTHIDTDTANRISKFLSERCTALKLPPSEVVRDAVDAMTGIAGIDSGELLLFAAGLGEPGITIFTGDKEAVIALGRNPSLSKLASSLQGRIYCLESILLCLIEKFGYVSVASRIHPKKDCDGLIALAFRSPEAAREIEAKDCLTSYANDLRRRSGLTLP